MSYLITLGLVEIIFNSVMDKVKMVLAGATTIKRERVPDEVINELVVFDGIAVDDGVGVGINDGAGVGDAGVLVLDNTKGLPLVDDVVDFSVRSVRNMMKIISCIYKN
ncbi:hypothetical protein EJD97_015956 [Solanum chilense]|uniref:Uncharacterized protein n=1 Tax=Solanum chilense TaxID=4083 RepID=A0A6N2B8J3_SOLCI|nr:hypothetical protein EJD97_015956 [Solanum chilense]